MPLRDLASTLPSLLDEIQRALHDQAVDLRESMTQDATSPEAIDGPGFYRIPWDALGRDDGEAKLAERAFTVRCLVTEDGGVPAPEQTEGLVAYVAKAY